MEVSATALGGWRVRPWAGAAARSKAAARATMGTARRRAAARAGRPRDRRGGINRFTEPIDRNADISTVWTECGPVRQRASRGLDFVQTPFPGNAIATAPMTEAPSHRAARVVALLALLWLAPAGSAVPPALDLR